MPLAHEETEITRLLARDPFIDVGREEDNESDKESSADSEWESEDGEEELPSYAAVVKVK